MPNRFTWHYMTFLRYFYERPGQRTFVVGADLAFMIPANTPRAFTTQHLNATEKPREWNLSSLSYQAGNPEMNAAMLTSHRIKTTPTDRLEISVVQQLFVELIEDQEGMRWCSDVVSVVWWGSAVFQRQEASKSSHLHHSPTKTYFDGILDCWVRFRS